MWGRMLPQTQSRKFLRRMAYTQSTLPKEEIDPDCTMYILTRPKKTSNCRRGMNHS